MKTTLLAATCLLLLTSCETPRNYRGPSIGVNLGFNEFSVGVTLFSSPSPASATLSEPPAVKPIPPGVTFSK